MEPRLSCGCYIYFAVHFFYALDNVISLILSLIVEAHRFIHTF
jgi:hypothetical protein